MATCEQNVMKDKEEEDDDDSLKEVQPETIFLFVVGIVEEWDKERTTIGDIGLINQYLNVGVPKDQIVFVKDSEATHSNCQYELEQFLKRTRAKSTLVFYYGGHGKPKGFCTHKKMWKYRDVVQTIESYFCGDKVIALVDCCASGNFCHWVRPPNNVKHSYACIMSVVSYTLAGDPWTLTASWIKAMQCNNNGTLQLSHVIDFLSDEIARVKGDIMAIYLTKDVQPDSTLWIPTSSGCCDDDDDTRNNLMLDWKKLQYNIPRDASVVGCRCSIGDLVYYKHPGGPCPTDPSVYIPPVWLRGTIQSKLPFGRLKLLVENSTSFHSWHVEEVSEKQLLNDMYTASHWMLTDEFFKAQCMLAKSSKYLLDCCSLVERRPMGMVISAKREEDGRTEDAIIWDWKDFDWISFESIGKCNNNPPYGPHIVVRWVQDNIISLIPLAHVENKDKILQFGNMTDTIFDYGEEKEMIMKNIHSFGKSIVDGEKIFGTRLVSCYWPEEDIWYDGEALELSSVSMEILASHAMFKPRGVYCPAYYDDGTFFLVPVHYVRPRRSSVRGYICCLP